MTGIVLAARFVNRVCLEDGCGRRIPTTWRDRPFCNHRSCAGKQRLNPLFWEYIDRRLEREAILQTLHNLKRRGLVEQVNDGWVAAHKQDAGGDG